MADYTVIVDDNFGGILYGPNANSWSPAFLNSTYQGTAHQAMSPDANLAFSFVGGREIFIQGNFVGDNNASVSTTYPIFQVDSTFLDCNPKPPQNGGQFVCGAALPPTITNRTLSMFENPNAEIQQFHIDYIRHGSDSQAARNGNETVVFVDAPSNMTQGLTFGGNWRDEKLGGANDIQRAMVTSTPSSTATYVFFGKLISLVGPIANNGCVGDSFAWWGCCMSADTSSNVANGTYSIDGGKAVPFQIDQNFIQGAQCHDEKILFQVQPGILNHGNHTLKVVYNGDNTKMPLTVCGLAAAPFNFNILDMVVTPSSTITEYSQHTTSEGPPGPSNTPSSGASTGSLRPDSGGSIRIIAGVVCGVVIAFIILFVSIIWWRKKRVKQQRQESRSSDTDSLYPFAFHPVVGFVDMEKQNSTILDPPPVSVMVSTGVSTEPLITDDQEGNIEVQTRSESSQLESRPPSYRTTGGSLLSL